MPTKKRDYKKEYATYHARPEQKKNRALRNAARREYEKTNGELPGNVDVHHKHRLAKGGTNTPGNTAAVTRKQNRGWRKGLKGYGR